MFLLNADIFAGNASRQWLLIVVNPFSPACTTFLQNLKSLQLNNSPGVWATELFKPSAYSASRTFKSNNLWLFYRNCYWWIHLVVCKKSLCERQNERRVIKIPLAKYGFVLLRYVSAFQRYQESIKYISTLENAQVNYYHRKCVTFLSLLKHANCSRKDTRKMLMQRWVLLLPRICLNKAVPKIKRFAIFTFSAGGEKSTRVHFAGSCTVPSARSGYCFTGINPSRRGLCVRYQQKFRPCFWQANKTLSRNSSSAERLCSWHAPETWNFVTSWS